MFDDGFDIRSAFLDVSKAFDEVWHERILLKLRQNDISGELLNLLCDFLRNRKQRVLNAGIPQGSMLAPLLFFDIHK